MPWTFNDHESAEISELQLSLVECAEWWSLWEESQPFLASFYFWVLAVQSLNAYDSMMPSNSCFYIFPRFSSCFPWDSWSKTRNSSFARIFSYMMLILYLSYIEKTKNSSPVNKDHIFYSVSCLQIHILNISTLRSFCSKESFFTWIKLCHTLSKFYLTELSSGKNVGFSADTTRGTFNIHSWFLLTFPPFNSYWKLRNKTPQFSHLPYIELNSWQFCPIMIKWNYMERASFSN